MNNNTVWHSSRVSKAQRAAQKAQQPCLIWYTGLSGSGKSTIANAVDEQLYTMGHHGYVLDGDNIRQGLNGDLGFSDEDRIENIRRIAEVAKLFVDAGILVSSAFISPFISERQKARALLPEGAFVEVFVDTPLTTCEQRDPKGLYQKARAGQIKQFTGIDSPYEPPVRPEVHIQTDNLSIEQCAGQVITYLKNHGFINDAL